MNALRGFNSWLFDIGNGALVTMSTTDGYEGNWIAIPQNLLIRNLGDPLASIVNVVYRSFITNFIEESYLRSHAF